MEKTKLSPESNLRFQTNWLENSKVTYIRSVLGLTKSNITYGVFANVTNKTIEITFRIAIILLIRLVKEFYMAIKTSLLTQKRLSKLTFWKSTKLLSIIWSIIDSFA